MTPRAPVRGRSFDDVAVGDAVDELHVVITLQRLIMEAGVNRDFSPWHFDPAVAAAAGADAPFANTTLVETLLEAAVRGWAGLAPRIRMLEFAMKVPTCVGDEVTATGVVTGKRVEGAARLVDLDVWLESQRGRTVQGSALVAF